MHAPTAITKPTKHTKNAKKGRHVWNLRVLRVFVAFARRRQLGRCFGKKGYREASMLNVHSPLSEEQEKIVTAAVDCGIRVHRELGPGFKEVIYRRAYCLELESRRLNFVAEHRVNVRYRDWLIPGQRIDIIVEEVVLVEIKAVPRLRPLHRSQVLSYLKTTGLRVGLLLNFNTVLLRQGLRRIVL
jgi:GxxExxY protein